MTIFAKAAVEARRLLEAKEHTDPREAWGVAVQKFTRSEESRKKSCPKVAFLVCCELGLVPQCARGFTAGDAAQKKRRYLVDALDYLRQNSGKQISKIALWKVVAGDTRHNGEMDVLLALA